MHFADLRNAILKRLEFYPNKKCKKRERDLNIVEEKEIGNIFLKPRDMEPPP